ncbi:hypothetical protein M501DRAFT_933269 [Patellaria atrata CBS 101060]|uniref:Signal peptide peptidase n=1 Tax=Patellaria atrata CBS 101060 TaxID=1346257 RepID=A0A9P4SC64_9PEZI|nr:hypothetical protein M501DRAFT_933269 [Patellaria atrata CBS 101060]
MAEPGPITELLGRLAFEFAEIQPLIPTYIHLILSALFPIYVGAHASLSRPASAAKPIKNEKKDIDHEESEDEETETAQKMEGLSPTDALMMPLFAGCTLAGLYFLLKWLQDPTLLNKILNWYFAIFGLASVGKLLTDGMDVVHSLIFPRVYVDSGILWKARASEKKMIPDNVDQVKEEGKSPRNTPLPGFLAYIPLSKRLTNLLWSVRELPKQKWSIRTYIHRLVFFKVRLGIHGILGLFTGLGVVAYFNFVDKPWYLTNLMGFAFAYGALQLLSPTTFGTGSLILAALFFYDIYFVFYTPMMVTVATSLDIPIKLVFPRPKAPDAIKVSHAMLGLGDVVLPGIMIGLALRFDLYLHYLRKQKVHHTSPSTESTSDSKTEDTNISQSSICVEKSEYHPLTHHWGDVFWTTSWFGKSRVPSKLTPHSTTPPSFSSPAFPKTYFKVSIFGYVIGMLATLIGMQWSNHAQPALLYLVPTVLLSLWLTALMRGEAEEMWAFSEAVEEEDFPAPNTLAPYFENGDDDAGNSFGSNEAGSPSKQRQRYEVVSFSISAPWPLKTGKEKKEKDEGSTKQTDVTQSSHEEARVNDNLKHNWTIPVEAKGGEPAGKRLRTS